MADFAVTRGRSWKASSLLLILADGRFPAGGHAHSGGLEEAVTYGRARTLEDLMAFLAGRLHTVGLVDASLAALSWVAALRRPPCRGAGRGGGPFAVARSARLPAVPRVAPCCERPGTYGPTGLWRDCRVAAQVPGGPMYPVVLGVVGKGIGLGVEAGYLGGRSGFGERPGLGVYPAARSGPLCGGALPVATGARH